MNSKRVQDEPLKPEEPFGYGVIDADNTAIVDAVNNMLRAGYSDDAIKRVVGVPQSIVDKHKANMQERAKQ
jgi:hypothetical protein